MRGTFKRVTFLLGAGVSTLSVVGLVQHVSAFGLIGVCKHFFEWWAGLTNDLVRPPLDWIANSLSLDLPAWGTDAVVLSYVVCSVAAQATVASQSERPELRDASALVRAVIVSLAALMVMLTAVGIVAGAVIIAYGIKLVLVGDNNRSATPSEEAKKVAREAGVGALTVLAAVLLFYALNAFA